MVGFELALGWWEWAAQALSIWVQMSWKMVFMSACSLSAPSCIARLLHLGLASDYTWT